MIRQPQTTGAVPPRTRSPQLTPRAGGPSLSLITDVLAQARLTGSWITVAVLVIAVFAALSVFVGQAVLPWAIYPAL